MEQAVISVFLSSQPIGHKALTHELIVLLGATKPDKIELEKALRRWMELSWFLDEVEVGTGEANPDGTTQHCLNSHWGNSAIFRLSILPTSTISSQTRWNFSAERLKLPFPRLSEPDFWRCR